MGAPRDRDLQRYFDGELPSRAAGEVRQHLESSPADRERLEGLQTVRELLQETVAGEAEVVSFDGLWAGVQAGIAARAPRSLGERLRDWLGRYGLVAASATVAAALVFFLLLPPGAPPGANDCEIESLDVDPEVAVTIFTHAEDEGTTTVIWVDANAEGEIN